MVGDLYPDHKQDDFHGRCLLAQTIKTFSLLLYNHKCIETSKLIESVATSRQTLTHFFLARFMTNHSRFDPPHLLPSPCLPSEPCDGIGLLPCLREKRIEGSEEEAYNVQGIGYWVTLAIYEALDSEKCYC